MHIFLPYPSFSHSAAILSTDLLNKQRMDCRQVLSALRYKRQGKKLSWIDHPLVSAWEGHESALALYMSLCVKEFIDRTGVDALHAPYNYLWMRSPGEDEYLASNGLEEKPPSWVGDERVHSSHRACLLSLSADYAFRYAWSELPSKDCLWK